MKITKEFLQETVSLFSLLYKRQVGVDEAEEIICNSLGLLETLGSTRKCGEIRNETENKIITV